MRTLSTIALTLLTILIMALYLPMLYEKLFVEEVKKTHLFYSPVSHRFVYTEKIVGHIPQESLATAEDHHADKAYRDQDGKWFTRVAYEKQLPFIYYKNMELWGLLPLKLDGVELNKKTIKENRQVMELKPGNIADNRPQIPLWPLLESNPKQARLIFPEDRFRITDQAIQFINVDTNTVEKELTELFSKALKAKDFVFPARSVNGKFTILKPFDEGAFIVDAKYQVFHLKRRDGKPLVVKTTIDPALKTRYLKISENQRREYYGLLLAGDGTLHLLTYDNYRLIELPLDNYDPERMDFKLIINPLYQTAIYSDETTIWAVAMNLDSQAIAHYEHRMSRAKITTAQRIYKALFPFSLHLKERSGGYLKLSLQSGGLKALIGIIGSIACFTVWCLIRRHRLPGIATIVLITLTGIYGLIAVNIVGLEDS